MAPGSPYNIAQGDTLWGIASRLAAMQGGETTPEAIWALIRQIQAANNIADPNRIRAGASLDLPGGQPSSAPAPGPMVNFPRHPSEPVLPPLPVFEPGVRPPNEGYRKPVRPPPEPILMSRVPHTL